MLLIRPILMAVEHADRKPIQSNAQTSSLHSDGNGWYPNTPRLPVGEHDTDPAPLTMPLARLRYPAIARTSAVGLHETLRISVFINFTALN